MEKTQREFLVEVRLRFEVTEVVSVNADDEQQAMSRALQDAEDDWGAQNLYETEVALVRERLQ